VAGHERVIEELGKCNIVEVRRVAARPLNECYVGTDLHRNRSVFVKVLRSHIGDVQRNFLNEIAVLRTFTGRPGFPNLVAASSEPPLYYHACDLINHNDCLTTEQTKEWAFPDILYRAAALAKWIAGFHNAGYAHRDLSPDHVFFLERGVIVIDFGMTKATGGLPVEKARCYKGYDLQAFGMIVWEMLAGYPIFAYRQPEATRQLVTEISILTDMPFPEPLRAVLLRCLCSRSDITPAGLLPYRSCDCVGETLCELESFMRAVGLHTADAAR